MDSVAGPDVSGLERLMVMDCVSVKQKNTALEKEYEITTLSGEFLFNVKEDTSALHARPISRNVFLDIYDASQHKVIRLRRPYTLGNRKMEVAVGGVVTSVVREVPTYFKKVLSINDAGDQPVLRIKGPWATEAQCDFVLQTKDKIPIGYIRKQFGEFLHARLSIADQFFIRFPLDLDVHYKAAVIGACFLIGFLYNTNTEKQPK